MGSYKNLLISEPPLQVLPSLAEKIGLNEAIILQQLHYWLGNSKVDGFVDEIGQKWIFNTYEEWKTNFPFWSEHTIRRIFVSLEKLSIVDSRQFAKGKYDRRKYYRINYDVLEQMNVPTCTFQINQDRGIESAKLDGSDEAQLVGSLNESEIKSKNTLGTGKEAPSGPFPKENPRKELQGPSAKESLSQEKVVGRRMADALGLFRRTPVLLPLIQAFIEASCIFPTEQTVSGWIKGTQELLAGGVTPKDIKYAIEKLRADGRTVYDPFSVLKVAISIHAENFRENQRQQEKLADQARYWEERKEHERLAVPGPARGLSRQQEEQCVHPGQ